MIEPQEVTLQVNKFAQRSRHMKIFSKKDVIKLHVMDALNYAKKPFRKLFELPYLNKAGHILNTVISLLRGLNPSSPKRKLLFQAAVLSGAMLVFSSLSYGGTFVSASMDYSYDYISAYSVPGDILVSDEAGYLIKINPQTSDSSRIGLTDYAVHTVESGEALSVIAERYGVNVNTIIWENNIGNKNSIRVGQKLMIPPVDGLSYKVNSKDTLDKIAEKYEVSKESIIAQNGIENETIVKGQTIFLPGAKPIAPPVSTIATNYVASPSASRDTRSYVNAAPSTAVPSGGKVFIYPTRGKITQGYHAGHYAIDIADTSRPPVWAAGGGTIEKASVGTWGGGYGNHVIIDHGNGLKTLYAHLQSVNVYQGQWVNQGDVIGIMGNTGRVYGATGIHLHWEVIQNGVKQYPGNYY